MAQDVPWCRVLGGVVAFFFFFKTIAHLVQGPSVKAMDSSVSQGRHLDQKLLAESTPVLEGGCFKLLPLLVASVPGSGQLQTGLGQGAFVIFMAAKHLFFF